MNPEIINSNILYYGNLFAGTEIEVACASLEKPKDIAYFRKLVCGPRDAIHPAGFSYERPRDRYLIVLNDPGIFSFTSWIEGKNDSEVFCILQIQPAEMPAW